MSDENNSLGKCDVHIETEAQTSDSKPASVPNEQAPLVLLETNSDRDNAERVQQQKQGVEVESDVVAPVVPPFLPQGPVLRSMIFERSSAERVQQKPQGAGFDDIAPEPSDDQLPDDALPHACMSEAIEGAKNLQQNGVKVASANGDEHAAKQPDVVREASRADTEKPIFRG